VGYRRARAARVASPGATPGFRTAAPDDPAARALLAEFARESEELYGQVFEGVAAPQDTIVRDGLAPPHGRLLVIDGVACGGLRRLDAHTAEVKRMYVRPEHRRKGHARHLLAALERAARELGYKRVRLDTGPLQPAAAALYASAGYHSIEAYTEMPPGSLFFEKELPPG
jgi:GNAT superfamily N-acetyltransferase